MNLRAYGDYTGQQNPYTMYPTAQFGAAAPAQATPRVPTRPVQMSTFTGPGNARGGSPFGTYASMPPTTQQQTPTALPDGPTWSYGGGWQSNQQPIQQRPPIYNAGQIGRQPMGYFRPGSMNVPGMNQQRPFQWTY